VRTKADKVFTQKVELEQCPTCLRQLEIHRKSIIYDPFYSFWQRGA
jgi:hypothetical protein